MEIDILDFVEQCRRLVKQALGKHAGEPASGGFARWVRVVLHCFRVEEEHSYRETPNRLKYMAELRDILELDQDDLPDYTTIYKSFDRLKMWVWRALLRVLFSRILMESRSLSDSEAEYAVKRLLYQGYLYEVDRQAFFTEREDDSPESG